MKRLAIVLLVFAAAVSCKQKQEYIHNQGFTFGTGYNFIYLPLSGKSLEQGIMKELKLFSASLSNYDSSSVISRINRNDESVIPDSFFVACFTRAEEISKITGGAFDITVAPVVNAWGFGFKHFDKVDTATIDSMMHFVGYQKIALIDNKIVKQDPRVQLDVSAIAKGYGVDVAANWLESQGIINYMVEIGGELRAKGVNAQGKPWNVGIDKPVEDNSLDNRQLQDIIPFTNRSMATSGNYRQFYEKNGVKYSHTINPHTGFPSRHSLLSSTIVASDCMTADALATACMVLGVEKSIELINSLPDVEAYFIYADSTGAFKTYKSPGMP